MTDEDYAAEPETAPHGGWYSNETATFGDRVAAGREVLGLNQADLARKLGVKLKTVQGWEEDLSEPRANKLQMLSGVLNVSLIWLLTGQGEGIAEPGSDGAISTDLSALLTEIRQIKGTISQAAEKLAGLEKRLRKALTDQV